jgi:hypothetical protein
MQMQYNGIIKLTGPNPPFVSVQDWQRGTDPNNPVTTVNVVVNPAQAGTFRGSFVITAFQIPLTPGVKVLGDYIVEFSVTVLP